MAEVSLKREGLKAGRYAGVLTAAGQVPVIEMVHLERVVAVAETTPVEGAQDCYHVAAQVPPSILSDGVQVVALRSAADGAVLDRLTFLMGEGLDGDFRAELALLRAELELLKSAFRRHCVETEAE